MNGDIVTKAAHITNIFAQYYQQLYTTKADYTPLQLSNYLDTIPIPRLSPLLRAQLNNPITLEEVQEAITSLQPNKTPGPDGLPADWYKASTELISPWLHKTLLDATEKNKLPRSFNTALIVVIPKEGKDPLECGSYRPISLLNVDAKIFAKILSNRLKSVIKELIEPDQTGFMPNRSTNINIRRLFTNIHANHANKGSHTIVSLDAAKAFDSVEWPYLLKLLERFGLGVQFIKWVGMLYEAPTARVNVNRCLSPEFSLSRGTRQGCPLSPLIFALAIEPLAILVRHSPGITGLKLGAVEERISLYADDVLLYLDSPGASLQTVLSIVIHFGYFSGLKINWDKSSIFPIDPNMDSSMFPPTPLQWVDAFKYLGIQVRRELSDFIPNNLEPILKTMKEKLLIWANLPLSIWGRINLLKMIFLPKFLYIFHNSPIFISPKFFTSLDKTQTAFLWANKPPRFSRAKLRAPTTEGGLGLPHWQFYSLAAQAYYVQWWFSPDLTNPNVPLQATLASSMESLKYIPFRKLSDIHTNHPVIVTPYKAWQKILHLYKLKPPILSPGLPLWGNSYLPNFQQIAPYRVWPHWGIRTLGDVTNAGALLPRDQIRHTDTGELLPWFSYLQLQQAFRHQFQRTIVPFVLTKLETTLRNSSSKKLITTLYSLLLSTLQSPFLTAQKVWHQDIPELDREDWEEATDRAYLISTRDKLIQFKIIHRLHLTPLRLYRMGIRNSSHCPKCGAPEANYFHLMWSCPQIHQFWNQILDHIQNTTSLPKITNPKVCLFGIVDDIIPQSAPHILYRTLLFYARKSILLQWMAQSPPTIASWLNLLKALLPLIQLTYIARGCPQKYDKVWGKWVEAME
uniref:Reverse transcriptase domain-containing protein n=1 Tax=Xenopus tropicalis TaxID=8364 RepID=A0A803JYV6_XENTR